MKFAILGTDSDILPLAAAAQKLGHEIVWVGDVRRDDAAVIERLAPNHEDRASEWELLLDGAVADAVLVGHGSAPTEVRAEQLKRLAAESVPMLVVQPVFESVLPYYEIDMTRREVRGIVRHYNPMAGHPAVRGIAAWTQAGRPDIGPIHQITCERRLSDDSRSSVVAHLARDVELIAAVAGDIRRITAIGPSADATSFASLQAQMSTSGQASLRWSVRPAHGTADGFEMTLIGERGTATLLVEEDASAGPQAAWALETVVGAKTDRHALEAYDAASNSIEKLVEAVAEPNAECRSGWSTWDAATRAMEVIDAAELSLEKGRTIDVYQQQLTERLAFRGTMAALGCGLLLVAFFAIVLVTLLGGAEQALGKRLLPAWPLVLLAVLALFLMLQVVPLLVGKSKASAPVATKSGDGP